MKKQTTESKDTRTTELKGKQTTESKVFYQVTFGPKTHSQRSKGTFHNRDQALSFYKKKEQEGLYVDAYEIQQQVITTTTKLSS